MQQEDERTPIPRDRRSIGLCLEALPTFLHLSLAIRKLSTRPGEPQMWCPKACNTRGSRLDGRFPQGEASSQLPHDAARPEGKLDAQKADDLLENKPTHRVLIRAPHRWPHESKTQQAAIQGIERTPSTNPGKTPWEGSNSGISHRHPLSLTDYNRLIGFIGVFWTSA